MLSCHIHIEMVFAFMAGHLTSRSDVYSFGVVLLEMITGRRSMDKNRPHGEQNLVEWAKPYLGEKRRFYRLIDPRLEGRYSVSGAQKALKLAAQCLNRDAKARPLMSKVVETLKPLPDLKDMAYSSSHFQAMQAERARASPSARTGVRSQSALAFRRAPPNRSLSLPTGGSNASPSIQNHPHRSPKTDG